MLSAKDIPPVPKRVPVTRCVFVFLFLAVLWAVHPAAADPSPPNTGSVINPGSVISDGTTGRVGIGTADPTATLDVYHGEIKIGSTGAACTAQLAGAMRSADARLQYCDGASWRNVSLDKAQ
jgi:hypothetical protein